MTRLFCLALVAALAINFPIQAQQEDPPKTFTNSIGMKFVWIPPGNFMMGCPKEEEQRRDNETQHKVTLSKGFYMGVSSKLLNGSQMRRRPLRRWRSPSMVPPQ
jgi:formylglycine-generating enzyme required for sulfatase activity